MDDLLEIAQMRGLRTAADARAGAAAPEVAPGAIGADASSDGPASSDVAAAEAEPAAPHDEGVVFEALADAALDVSGAAAAASRG